MNAPTDKAIAAHPMDEPSALNLWASQWRTDNINRARSGYRQSAAAYDALKNKTTDYARSIKTLRDVSAQVLAVWEASPVDLPDAELVAGYTQEQLAEADAYLMETKVERAEERARQEEGPYRTEATCYELSRS